MTNEEFTDQIMRAVSCFAHCHFMRLQDECTRPTQETFNKNCVRYYHFIERFIAKHRNDAAPELKWPFIRNGGADECAGPNNEGLTMISIYEDQK